jgi:hypothetical protein
MIRPDRVLHQVEVARAGREMRRCAIGKPGQRARPNEKSAFRAKRTSTGLQDRLKRSRTTQSGH